MLFPQREDLSKTNPTVHLVHADVRLLRLQAAAAHQLFDGLEEEFDVCREFKMWFILVLKRKQEQTKLNQILLQYEYISQAFEEEILKSPKCVREK